MEIINQASEKFKDKQEEICGLLFPFLRRVTVLEKEIYERSQELREQKAKLGYPPSQVGPGEKELRAEYKERLGEIVNMKTAKRATVITHYEAGVDSMHKFVVRDVDGKWLLDEVYYGFESEPDKWYSDNIR